MFRYTASIVLMGFPWTCTMGLLHLISDLERFIIWRSFFEQENTLRSTLIATVSFLGDRTVVHLFAAEFCMEGARARIIFLTFPSYSNSRLSRMSQRVWKNFGCFFSSSPLKPFVSWLFRVPSESGSVFRRVSFWPILLERTDCSQ